jgi:hypothetical protein
MVIEDHFHIGDMKIDHNKLVRSPAIMMLFDKLLRPSCVAQPFMARVHPNVGGKRAEAINGWTTHGESGRDHLSKSIIIPSNIANRARLTCIQEPSRA